MAAARAICRRRSSSRCRRRLILTLARAVRLHRSAMALMALVIGVAVALLEFAFRSLIGETQAFWYGEGHSLVITIMEDLAWWHVLLGPTVGGLGVALLLRFYMPGGRPQGIPHVMAATAFDYRTLTAGRGVWAAVVSAFSIGVGASVGREGPAVHMGASFAAVLARTLRLPRNRARVLIGCAAGAAVAASFNAPIAGALFAHEVVVGHYALSAFAPVVLSTVTATILSRLHYGDFPAFIVPVTGTPEVWEYLAFAVLGLAAGGVATLFGRGITGVNGLWERVRFPFFWRPVVAGLITGMVAVFLPQVMGVGYQTTDHVLNGTYTALGFLFLVLVAKLGCSVLCLGSGFGGGVFSPSLTLGALLGGVTAAVVQLLPVSGGEPVIYGLVGMGAVAGAVLGAPISTILMIFELTGNYEVAAATMVAVVVAGLTTDAVFRPSFFLWALEKMKIDLSEGYGMGRLAHLTPRDVALRPCPLLAAEAPLDAVRTALQQAADGVVVVKDPLQVRGVVRLADLGPLAFHRDCDSLVLALDAARAQPAPVPHTASLRTVLARMDSHDYPVVPVVHAEEPSVFLGLLRREDVHALTNRLLRER